MGIGRGSRGFKNNNFGNRNVNYDFDEKKFISSYSDYMSCSDCSSPSNSSNSSDCSSRCSGRCSTASNNSDLSYDNVCKNDSESSDNSSSKPSSNSNDINQNNSVPGVDEDKLAKHIKFINETMAKMIVMKFL